MKLVLSITLSIALSFLMAQSEFNITTKVDEFSGAKTTQTSWMPLSKSLPESYIALAYYDSGNTPICLLMLVTTTGEQYLHADKKDVLHIKLGDLAQTIIQLSNTGLEFSKRNYGFPLRHTDKYGIRVMCLISQDDVLNMSLNGISKCRLTTSKGYINMSNDYGQEELQKNIKQFYKKVF